MQPHHSDSDNSRVLSRFTLTRRNFAGSVAIAYLCLGSLWISVSDHLLHWLTTDTDTLTRMQNLKGWFFIAVTGAMLYGLLHWASRQLNQTEAALRDSQEQHRLAIDLTGVGIWDWDLIKNQGSANANDFRLLGLDPTQGSATYQTWRDRIHPEDLEQVETALHQALQTHGDYETEYRVIHPDGSIHWLSARARGIYDRAGQPLRMVGIAIDITERKQAEINFQQQHEIFQTIFDHIPVMVGLYSATGEILLINRELEQELGWQKEEYSRVDVLRACYPDPADYQRVMQHIVTADGTWKDFKTRTRDGRVLDTCWAQIPLSDGRSLGIGQDITSRKQAENSLRQSEAFLRTVISSMPVIIWAIDRQGIFTLSEGKGLGAIGLQPGQVVGVSIYEVYQDYPDMLQTFRQTLATADPFAFPFDHQGRTLEVWGSAIHDAQGKVSGLIGVASDITERKQAENVIRQSEARLRQMLENMPVMLDALDEAGQIVVWNQECERVTGYAAAEIVGNPDAMHLLYPDEHYRHRMMRAWAERGNDYRNWEWEITCKDGGVRAIAWSNISDHFPIPGWAAWGIGVDVTERKQAEMILRRINQELEQRVEIRTADLRQINQQLQREIQERQRIEIALRQSEELFRQVFENAPLGIVLAEPTETRMVMVNPAFCEMLGYTVAELLNLSYENFSDTDDLEREKSFAEQLLSGGIAGYQLEKRYIRQDQQRIWGNLTTRTIRNQSGEILYLLGMVEDITQRKQAEATLAERTRQLEVTNRELESFSYSVSHDLRAPLRHIGGFVAALEDRLQQMGDLQDDRVTHYLQIIRESSQKMAQLIDGLLMLSRLGRRQMELKSVDLTALVQTVVQQVSQSLEPHRRGSVEFAIGQLPMVMGDATLLQQVFANLLDNAVKFSRDRQPARISIDSLSDGTVFVRDNGVGFKMEYADQLFGAFQRLHSQTEFPGMGIGLAIVQRIIHRHGGSIWADSAPEQGACFYFKLGTTEDGNSGASRTDSHPTG